MQDGLILKGQKRDYSYSTNIANVHVNFFPDIVVSEKKKVLGSY